MSGLDPQFVSALEVTLKEVLDGATTKTAATKLSKELLVNNAAIAGLLQVVETSQEDAVSRLALVEARKLIKKKWTLLDPELQNSVMQLLIKKAFEHRNEMARHLCSECIAAIAETDAESQFLAQILPTLSTAVQDSNVQTRESAVFTLFALLKTELPALVEHVGDFLVLFANILGDSSRQIRVNAVRSLDILAYFIDEAVVDTPAPEQIKLFQSTIPGMVAVAKDALVSDSDATQKIFTVFNNILYLDSSILGDSFLILLDFCCEVAGDASVDEDGRIYALNMLTSCVSFRKSKITSNKLGPRLTMLAAKIASEEIDVEEELDTEEEENTNEESTPNSLAFRLIQELSNELPPSQVIVPLFEAFNTMLTSANMFERRAGLLIIAYAVEGSSDYISNYVPKLIPVILNGLKDSEMIVKLAALKTVYRMTTSLKDEIATYHEQLLPLVIEIIDNTKSVLVYKYGCLSLDRLIEFMDQDAIGTYLEPLMGKLFHMLQQANTSSLKQVIVSAIGSAAYASGKKFTPFFPTAIQNLEPFIQNAANVEGLAEDDIELRALSFEMISLMAKAVGSEAFSQFANQLVEAAYGTLSSDNSRIREAGFSFISDMAKVFGNQFSSFLENLIPLIVKCLEQDEITVGAMDEPEDLFDEEEDDEDNLKVNTGVAFEKEIAVYALAELAVGTDKDFIPYVSQSIEALTKEFKESLFLSEAALSSMWKIVRSMYFATKGDDYKYPKGMFGELYVDPFVFELIKHVRTLSLETLLEGYDPELLMNILENLSNAIDLMGGISVMDPQDADGSLLKLCNQIDDLLKNALEDGQNQDEDSTEDDIQLFKDCLEVLISLSTALEQDFSPIFAKFKPLLVANSTIKNKDFRLASVGSLAQISEGLKLNNTDAQELLQLFIDRLTNDKNLDVRGDAAYGVGIIIEYATFDTSAIYPTLLTLLNQLLSKTDRRADKLSNAQNGDELEAKLDVVNRAYANACGCVSRMVLKHPELVPLPAVLPVMLAHLPLDNGLEENVPIFSFIAKLYETKSEIASQALPQVIEIFSKVFVKESDRLKLLSSSTMGREEEFEALKQFPVAGLKEKVVALLKHLDTEYQGVVSANEILKMVIA